MKRILIFGLAGLALAGCTGQQTAGAAAVEADAAQWAQGWAAEQDATALRQADDEIARCLQYQPDRTIGRGPNRYPSKAECVADAIAAGAARQASAADIERDKRAWMQATYSGLVEGLNQAAADSAQCAADAHVGWPWVTGTRWANGYYDACLRIHGGF